jgi:flagellar biosynthesis GTPase FlhF
MSTQLTEHHTNGHDRSPNGVRTYRGRKLEDLIPQIRAELGPDAIILRQREGLTGGVGGFFAQKCVEVDAQAAGERDPIPRIDIYDEDEPVNGWDEGLEDFVAPAGEEPSSAPAPAAPQPALERPTPGLEQLSRALEQAAAGGAAIEEPAAFAAEPAPAFAPPAPPVSEPAATPVNGELSAESFVSRLEQAAAHVDIDELVKLVTSGRVLGSEAPAGPAPEASDPAPLAGEHAAPATPETIIEIPVPVAPEIPIAEAPAPVAPAGGAGPIPPPSPGAPAQAGEAGPIPPVPPAASPWAAKQAGDLDSDEAAAVTAELTAQGVSETWAHQLIVAAAAHRAPLANGTLRDAVRATLAATIPAPAPLPPSGAAVAFVGAGGAGKTRCAAALASAYARGSTLAASVVSLGSDDWGGDLKELLKGQNVWVMGAASGAEAAPAVHHGRDGGLVVVDTAAATPRDPDTVETLAAELRSLSLDAAYIAVPATFSVHAARKLIDGFAALGADGIAVTHADEADQLGIAAELSHISGMPVAYINEGLQLDGGLTAADPSSLAARLLP